MILSQGRQVLWETRRLDKEMKVSWSVVAKVLPTEFVSRLLRNAENSETPAFLEAYGYQRTLPRQLGG